MNVFKLITSVLSFYLLSLAFTSGQLYANQVDKVVLHINNPTKMTMLVNGPAVARFSTAFSSRKQLDEILHQKATVNICSFALKNKKIPKEQLFDGVTYLEDGGVSTLVKLQQQGYVYIKL